MPVQNLDLHLLKSNGHFQIELYNRGNSESLATAIIDLPPQFFSGLRQLDFDVRDPAQRFSRLRDFGFKLYQQLFQPEIERVWSEHKRASEFAVLCIRIAPNAEELEAIPWETLFDGEDFIAAGTKSTISRLPTNVSPQTEPSPVPLPIKILALVSSPLNLPDGSRLQVEREQEILLEAINDPAGQGRLRADFEDEAKLEVLESSLEAPYQVFHFTGHGMAPDDGGGLLLEDTQGNSRPTSVMEVVQSLSRGQNSLRLVVLSGCQTARTIDVGGFRDMAGGLLRRGVPSVIAMQFSISDIGGLKFAESLYTRIAAGRPLELACHAARRAMLVSDNHFVKADALAPVLLTANGDCLQTTQEGSDYGAERPRLDFSFFLPLPQLSHGFYGRRREYRQVRDGILQRNQRAVIIYGIGGIGKTALVSHVATRMKKRFQGIYAFDCSSGTLNVETVMIKLSEYFSQLGIRDLEQLLYRSLPADKLATFLAQILSSWRLLLIFDNFETQLERTDEGFRISDENFRTFISILVKATATNSHFLFTSRYLFELDEKRIGAIQQLPLKDLSRPEALSLMQKLQHLAPASHGEKLEALKTFGGHPYALVTLDRYCNHQPLSRALEDAKNIHGELRKFLAIEINYAQLAERSRQLLDRLAAFRQSVPYSAAEWVLGEKLSPPTDLVDRLKGAIAKEGGVNDATLEKLMSALPQRRQATSLDQPIKELVEWGLLMPVEENGELKEISIHALVRDFCRYKQPPEVWRHNLREAAAFYTNFTKLIKAEDKTPEAIWTELGAFELLMEAEEFVEASRLLTNAAQLLDRWGFTAYSEAQHHRLVGKLDKKRDAKILHNLGILMQARGEYEKALEYYRRSLETFDELGAREEKAGSLYQIGTTLQARSEDVKAMEHYEQALKIYEQVSDHTGVAASLHQIGILEQGRGNYDKAREYYEQSLHIHDQLGDRHGMTFSLLKMGDLEQAMGNTNKAREYYEQALEISEQLNSPLAIALTLYQIGTIFQEQNEYEKALDYAERSLKVFEQLGERANIAASLGQIGNIMARMGQQDEAFHYLLSALTVFIELGSPNTGVIIRRLRELRAHWGEENFSNAWKETTGQDVPKELLEIFRLIAAELSDG